MISQYFPALWTAAAPLLGNHLWQSTLFAITAGLLTLTLRKNHARIRYRLWLVASMKFLIPFSLLIGLGSHLAWFHGSAPANAGLYSAIEDVSQPFTQPALSAIPQATPSAVSSIPLHLPALLATLWLCGFLGVLFVWYARWRGVSNALRIAEPLWEGRELDTLRHLESSAGSPKHIQMFLSRTSLEPGIFGIIRPVLLWPAGISDRLEGAHLEVILAHELWHVRRRDNLAAALHMLVEAIFWFHPLVWWLGSRLVEERELACDEAVLQSGSDRQVYAESILKICEFCVGSPLACVSGVTGADLKKRMVHIMTKSSSRDLNFTKKLFLSAFASAVIAIPILLGLLDATQTRAQSQAHHATASAPAFEAVSITPNKNGEPMTGFKIKGRPMHAIMWKPDRFMATNFSLPMLLMRGYDVQADQILGGPSWLNSENFDVEARLDQSSVQELARLSPDQGQLQRQRMLQALLSDRFKLSFHHETKDLSVFALVVAANGLKLQPAKSGDTYPNGLKCSDAPCGAGVLVEPEKNKLVAQGVPISNLLRELSLQLGGRLVVDKTALMGNYDFTLSWPPEGNQDSLRTAIQDLLGLKLETQKLPVDVLVIDHAEMPSDSHAQNVVGTSLLATQSGAGQASSTPSPTPDWQGRAAGKQSFVVASVKQNNSGSESSSMNIPIAPGDVYPPNGGLLSATNVPLISYIYFAYKLTGSQLQLLVPQLPRWVLKDKFDIEARADGNPTKDQMRLMTRSLLADRFKLVIHYETQQLPVFAIVLALPGKTGPRLQPHPEGSSCLAAPPPSSATSSPATIAGGLPSDCGGIVGMPLSPSGRLRVGARNVPIGLLATTLAQMGNLDRPVLDQSGLRGTFDFTFEWTPQHNRPLPSGVNAPLGEPGPTFQQELKEQLGLKLESQNGPTEILVIDHVEKPSEM